MFISKQNINKWVERIQKINSLVDFIGKPFFVIFNPIPYIAFPPHILLKKIMRVITQTSCFINRETDYLPQKRLFFYEIWVTTKIWYGMHLLNIFRTFSPHHLSLLVGGASYI